MSEKKQQVIKVQINGGEIVEVASVKVIVENVPFNDRFTDDTGKPDVEDYDGELRTGKVDMTFNHKDAIVNLIDESDEVIATTTHGHDEIAQNTYDRG
jgi:hypothetical protein